MKDTDRPCTLKLKSLESNTIGKDIAVVAIALCVLTVINRTLIHDKAEPTANFEAPHSLDKDYNLTNIILSTIIVSFDPLTLPTTDQLIAIAYQKNLISSLNEDIIDIYSQDNYLRIIFANDYVISYQLFSDSADIILGKLKNNSVQVSERVIPILDTN
jgi:hypothetical protein